jgi:hypothetical protein
VLWTAGASATLIIVTLVTPGCNPVLGSKLTFPSLVRVTISSVGVVYGPGYNRARKVLIVLAVKMSHGHLEGTIGTID